MSGRRDVKKHLARRPVASAAELPHAFRPTALELPDGLSYDAWASLGRDVLRPMARGMQWWIGDWLNFGERRYGEKYAQAIDVTGYDYATLNGLRWVAERVEVVRRRTNLSWSHHKEVAALEPADQKRWLDRAERESLTRADLRAAVREAKLLPAAASGNRMPDGAPRCADCGQSLVCPRCRSEVATDGVRR